MNSNWTEAMNVYIHVNLGYKTYQKEASRPLAEGWNFQINQPPGCCLINLRLKELKIT